MSTIGIGRAARQQAQYVIVTHFTLLEKESEAGETYKSMDHGAYIKSYCRRFIESLAPSVLAIPNVRHFYVYSNSEQLLTQVEAEITKLRNPCQVEVHFNVAEVNEECKDIASGVALDCRRKGGHTLQRGVGRQLCGLWCHKFSTLEAAFTNQNYNEDYCYTWVDFDKHLTPLSNYVLNKPGLSNFPAYRRDKARNMGGRFAYNPVMIACQFTINGPHLIDTIETFFQSAREVKHKFDYYDEELIITYGYKKGMMHLETHNACLCIV